MAFFGLSNALLEVSGFQGSVGGPGDGHAPLTTFCTFLGLKYSKGTLQKGNCKSSLIFTFLSLNPMEFH